MRAVGFGHVLWQCSVAITHITAHVYGDPFSFVKAFKSVVGCSYVHRLVNIGIWNTVVVVIKTALINFKWVSRLD